MEKVKGILAYLFGWLGGLIVFLISNENQNTKFHGAQALVLSVLSVIITAILGALAGILGQILGILGAICGLLVTVWGLISFILMILGIVKVVKETDPELPIVGDITHSIFKI